MVANTNSIAKDVTKFIILVIIMNEKRFRVIFSANSYAHFFDGEKEIDEFEVVKLLNRYSSLLVKQTEQTNLEEFE